MNEVYEALALRVLGWILSDQARGERLLALTGLTPDSLRSSLDERRTLVAILTFLTAHEADLLACAEALQLSPSRLAATAQRLEIMSA